jgi:hypothetical protein
MVGIDCIGIDVGNLSGETFEHHQLDLLQPGALDFIPDHSIDLANSYGFLNSPELEKRVTGTERFTDASPEASRKAEEVLFPQLERIVKPEGYFLYCENHDFRVCHTGD